MGPAAGEDTNKRIRASRRRDEDGESGRSSRDAVRLSSVWYIEVVVVDGLQREMQEESSL